MQKIRTQAIIVLIAGLVMLAPLHANAQQQAHSWWLAAFPQSAAAQNPITTQSMALLSRIDVPPDASFHQTIDAMRAFIQNHSLHMIDDEFYRNWGNIAGLMQIIGTNAQNSAAPKAHMECATRSAVMYHMLTTLGYHVRPVVVYPPDDPSKSHTFLEVMNPDTHKWEVQDPDMNLYWIFKNTKKRASLADLLSHPLKDTFLPCRRPDDCSYTDRENAEFLRKFALASPIDIKDGRADWVLNPQRFSPDHKFLQGKRSFMYCPLVPEDACHTKIIELGQESAPSK